MSMITAQASHFATRPAEHYASMQQIALNACQKIARERRGQPVVQTALDWAILATLEAEQAEAAS